MHPPPTPTHVRIQPYEAAVLDRIAGVTHDRYTSVDSAPCRFLLLFPLLVRCVGDT